MRKVGALFTSFDFEARLQGRGRCRLKTGHQRLWRLRVPGARREPACGSLDPGFSFY